MSRSIFIESLVGNIKEKYFFEKKLGSGGYGAVYLAKDKKSGKFIGSMNVTEIILHQLFSTEFISNSSNLSNYRRKSCN